jgi:hypothetical protein
MTVGPVANDDGLIDQSINGLGGVCLLVFRTNGGHTRRRTHSRTSTSSATTRYYFFCRPGPLAPLMQHPSSSHSHASDSPRKPHAGAMLLGHVGQRSPCRNAALAAVRTRRHSERPHHHSHLRLLALGQQRRQQQRRHLQGWQQQQQQQQQRRLRQRRQHRLSPEPPHARQGNGADPYAWMEAHSEDALQHFNVS